MATIRFDELPKHNWLYFKNLIKKIENKEEVLIERNKNKFTDKITLPKETLNSLKNAKNLEELEPIFKDGKKFKKVFISMKTKKPEYKLNEISKDSLKDKSSRQGDAKTTQMQEKASLKIFEILLDKNKKYSLSDLVDIYPDVINDKSWQISFESQYEQFKKIAQIFKLKKMKYYNRDGEFMHFITTKVRDFGISKKDTWNPADIWLIKDDNVQKELKECKTLQELNDKMIEMLFSGRLVGISLKKAGKTGKYEILNVTKSKERQVKKKKEIVYPFESGKLLLNLKSNGAFANDEFNYVQDYNGKAKLLPQIRMYPKKNKARVQVSYKLKGAKAELGKVPAKLRDKILLEYSSKFIFPFGKDIPFTFEDFEKEENEWKKRFNTIVTSGINIELNVNNFSEFKNNVELIYSNKDKNYIETELCTKLQGLIIAYYFAELYKIKKLDELLTKWVYFAEKKTTEGGPFIKVY